MAKKRIPKQIKNLVLGYTNRLEREMRLPVGSVYVYGSYARGTATKQSDIDVCIVSPKFRNSLDVLQKLFQYRTAHEAMAGIEPIGFSPKQFRHGGILVDEIKRFGIKIR